MLSQLADEHVKSWRTRVAYVGCSGAFTIERHIHHHGFELHSNDILLYSAMVGGYFSGHPFQLVMTDTGREEIGWVEEYLDRPERALATVLLLSSRLSRTFGRGNKVEYHEKLRDAFHTQWPRIFQLTLDRIQAYAGLSIASYSNEDVMTWLDRVPEGAAVISYPPFQASGASQYFLRDFAAMEKVFEWTTPPFTPLEGDDMMKLYMKIAAREEWLFATNKAVPDLRQYLHGVAQLTNRAPRVHLYASSSITRRIAPFQKLDAPKIRHLTSGQSLEFRTLRLSVLTPRQFRHLRSMYMNINIRPGVPDLSVAVIVDGYLVGAYACALDVGASQTFATWKKSMPQPVAYMLSDFPVSGSDYGRLAKLVVMAAYTRESQLLIQRHGKRGYRSMTTTAFSANPVSMKYRGVLHLLKRDANQALKESYGSTLRENDTYYTRPWALQYGGELGLSTCAEALAEWVKKHKDKR